jgi:hypothetical protein
MALDQNPDLNPPSDATVGVFFGNAPNQEVLLRAAALGEGFTNLGSQGSGELKLKEQERDEEDARFKAQAAAIAHQAALDAISSIFDQNRPELEQAANNLKNNLNNGMPEHIALAAYANETADINNAAYEAANVADPSDPSGNLEAVLDTALVEVVETQGISLSPEGEARLREEILNSIKNKIEFELRAQRENKLSISPDSLVAQIKADEKLLLKIKGLHEHNPTAETHAMLEQQEASIRVSQGLQELSNDGYDLSNISFVEVATVIPANLQQDYITSLGGQEAYEKLLLEAGITPEEIAARQELSAAIQTQGEKLQSDRADFDSQNIARTSDLENWNKSFGSSRVDDYYIFENADGNFELLGANWTDSITARTITPESRPELYAEIKAKSADGTLNIGSDSDRQRYKDNANSLSYFQYSMNFAIEKAEAAKQENGDYAIEETQSAEASEGSGILSAENPEDLLSETPPAPALVPQEPTPVQKILASFEGQSRVYPYEIEDALTKLGVEKPGDFAKAAEEIALELQDRGVDVPEFKSVAEIQDPSVAAAIAAEAPKPVASQPNLSPAIS